MWYIARKNKHGERDVSAVKSFVEKGADSVKIWRETFDDTLTLPFSYDDFNLIFTYAAKKNEIPDFSDDNFENLRQWLQNYKSKQIKPNYFSLNR